MAVLEVTDLALELAAPGADGLRPRPVDGVSFQLSAGQTLALVGESGSGKTLTALALLGLLPAGVRVAGGTALYRDRNLLRLSERDLRRLRGRELGLVSQDPLGALHPMLTVERQLTEAIETHERVTRGAARRQAAEMLIEVGLRDPERVLAAYPHQLSGGMRQRVLVAMAVLLRPKVLIADEPTTALDPSLQTQVLELFAELQRRHGLALLLISHDLARVATFADRVHVLYSGRTAESAPARDIFRRPLHPYTRGLLASTLSLDTAPTFPLPAIPGQPPEPGARPSGCAFHPRCSLAKEPCRAGVPVLSEPRPGRTTACLEIASLLAEGAR